MKHLFFILIAVITVTLGWSLSAQAATNTRVTSLIEQIADEEQLDKAVLLAIAEQSQFNPQFVGKDGRLGVMQLPAELMQDYYRTKPASLFDVQTSSRLAARYLTQLLQQYQGDLRKALYHYASGEAPGVILRQPWFAPQRHWVQRVYRASLPPTMPASESGYYCSRPLYLDDFSDPNSRLNQHRMQTEPRCRYAPCLDKKQQCDRFY